MNVFEAVKQSVTTRDVAELYGIKVRRNGVACCPFHDDRTPSMKLDKRFHCFGCQADGDAVDFVAKLYGLSLKDAAVKIADDFGIDYNLKQHTIAKRKVREPTKQEMILQMKNHTTEVLSSYLSMLLLWEREYAPHSPEDDFHPLFVEALQWKDYLDYLLDLVDTTPKENMEALLSELQKEVKKYESRIAEYQSDRGNQRKSLINSTR